MAVRPLKPMSPFAREKQLEELLLNWDARAASGWRVAGGASWLRGMRNPRRTGKLPTSLGWKFEPDLLFEDAAHVYVVELKRSPPQMPDGSPKPTKDPIALALPEVLHQAWMLSTRSELREQLGLASKKKIVPVIISPTSGWLRASMAFLLEHGLRSDALRYLEFEPLVDGDRKLLWIGEPLAPWTRERNAPQGLHKAFDFEHWYTVADERAWFGLTNDCPQRPPFVDCRYVEAALIEGTAQEYVACTGAYGAAWEYSIVGGNEER